MTSLFPISTREAKFRTKLTLTEYGILKALYMHRRLFLFAPTEAGRDVVKTMEADTGRVPFAPVIRTVARQLLDWKLIESPDDLVIGVDGWLALTKDGRNMMRKQKERGRKIAAGVKIRSRK